MTNHRCSNKPPCTCNMTESTTKPCSSSRTRTSRSLLFVATLLSVTRSSRAFVAVRQARTTTTTQRYYRPHNDELVLSPPPMESIIPSASTTATAYLPEQEQQFDHLPTWLQRPVAHLHEKLLDKLVQTMISDSFFTETQIHTVVSAVKRASRDGDASKTAGIAEFLLIMVETMDMGVDALVAAAFHYSSCLDARRSRRKDAYMLQKFLSDHVGEFGTHAVEIARDAARIKELEMIMASTVLQDHAVNAENFLKLLSTESKNWRALAIRSAASLYRLRGIASSHPTELTPEIVQTCRQALHVYSPLASRLGMHRLKSELEGTAFGLLYRRQYNKVTSLAKEKRNDDDQTIGDSMSEVLESVTQEVRDMLHKNADFGILAENVSVTARVKEPYSMWRKMLRNHQEHILDVPDALALRVVFDAKRHDGEDAESVRQRERQLCYFVQELCMERWRPNADHPRFKDYIENPKPNGYQSLHYTANTVKEQQDWSLEIQIRSREMHKVAEYGPASHWDYKKAKGKSHNHAEPSTTSSTMEPYLLSVQKWSSSRSQQNKQAEAQKKCETDECKMRADRIRARTARLSPYIQAFQKSQSDLVRQHVFVFVSSSNNKEGQVLKLPAGACVLDAMRALGQDTLLLGNGGKARMTQKLTNGDILVMPSSMASM